MWRLLKGVGSSLALVREPSMRPERYCICSSVPVQQVGTVRLVKAPCAGAEVMICRSQSRVDVPQALAHFFRTDNLIALRELALRFVADESDEELSSTSSGTSLRSCGKRPSASWRPSPRRRGPHVLLRRGPHRIQGQRGTRRSPRHRRRHQPAADGRSIGGLRAAVADSRPRRPLARDRR